MVINHSELRLTEIERCRFSRAVAQSMQRVAVGSAPNTFRTDFVLARGALPVSTLIDAFQRHVDFLNHFLIAVVETAYQTRDAVFLGILLNLAPTLFDKRSCRSLASCNTLQ